MKPTREAQRVRRSVLALEPGRVVRPQRGVVLVIALILLVVAAFSSMFVMRSAIFGEQISNNIRSGTLAERSAEVALRYCEQFATPNPPAVGPAGGSVPTLQFTKVGATPTAWTIPTNWQDGGAAVKVPQSLLNSGGSTSSGIQYVQSPQCMIEDLPLPTVDPKAFPSLSYLVTARGFSPDGKGEAWMQSTVRVY